MLKVKAVSVYSFMFLAARSASQVENYKLFRHVICKSMVPTVLVVTGLEEEDSKDAWWQANKAPIREQGIAIDYHACITSTQGEVQPEASRIVYQTYTRNQGRY